MNTIQLLKERASVKKFDPNKKISNADIEILIEAGNLSASSGGLQPYKMVVVSNDSLKKELVAHSYNQSQVADASHLLVFAVETSIGEPTVKRYVERAAAVRNQSMESLQGYYESMKGYVESMGAEQQQLWARNQAYIALGSVMIAAAELGIDSCPMEGFLPDQYKEVLGLSAHGLHPVVILPVGYKSDEDVYSKAPKVRKTREDFVVEI